MKSNLYPYFSLPVYPDNQAFTSNLLIFVLIDLPSYAKLADLGDFSSYISHLAPSSMILNAISAEWPLVLINMYHLPTFPGYLAYLDPNTLQYIQGPIPQHFRTTNNPDGILAWVADEEAHTELQRHSVGSTGTIKPYSIIKISIENLLSPRDTTAYWWEIFRDEEDVLPAVVSSPVGADTLEEFFGPPPPPYRTFIKN